MRLVYQNASMAERANVEDVLRMYHYVPCLTCGVMLATHRFEMIRSERLRDRAGIAVWVPKFRCEG